MAERPLDVILDELRKGMSDLAVEIENQWLEAHDRIDYYLTQIEARLGRAKEKKKP